MPADSVQNSRMTAPEPAGPPDSSEDPSGRIPVGHLRLRPWELFVTFAGITLSGFGGTMFWARLILVERRRLLTDREFVEMLSVAQLIPGANMVNMTAMFAYRTGGLRGLLAAMAGFSARRSCWWWRSACSTSAMANCSWCRRRSAACRRWRWA